jgi:NADP-dependent 3-hydroxy acid dehydrogenase YdfG
MEGKVAMIIGAVNETTSGIVKALLEQGTVVMAPVKSLQQSNWLKAVTGHITTGRLMTHITDMPDFEKANDIAESIVEKFGRIDIAVNVMVANKKDTGLSETDICDWEKMLDENITPCFVMNRIIINIMKQEHQGVYISITEKPATTKTCSSLSRMANTVQMQLLTQFAEEAESNGIRYYHLFITDSAESSVITTTEDSPVISSENIGAEILRLYAGEKRYQPVV